MFSTALLVVGFLAAFHRGDAAAPTFAGTVPTTATINEISAVGYVVSSTVLATGTTITYPSFTQTPDTTPKKFAVDSSTGAITVLTADLSAATQASYVLVITAISAGVTADSATHTLTVTVAANVIPVFAIVPACIIVADATAASTAIGTVVVTDANSDTITYSIDATSNTNTDFGNANAVISTAKLLARATTSSYALKVLATDTSLTASVTITVCVGSTSQCSCGSSSDGAMLTAGIITTIGVLVAMLAHLF